MLRIDPKIRSEEQSEFLKAYIQDKNTLENLINNKTHEIDQQVILDCFSKFMEIQIAQKNEVLFRMDDTAEKFYIVLKGSVEIFIPEKRKFWLSRWEYYKYLENNLYEEEIGLVKSILNSNYEKISFDNYDEFYEFAKAKAKIALLDKFKTVSDENSLEEFYKEKSLILSIFKIANGIEELNYLAEDKNIVEMSESNETSMSEKDSSDSDTDDKIEEYDKYFLNSTISGAFLRSNKKNNDINKNHLNSRTIQIESKSFRDKLEKFSNEIVKSNKRIKFINELEEPQCIQPKNLKSSDNLRTSNLRSKNISINLSMIPEKNWTSKTIKNKITTKSVSNHSNDNQGEDNIGIFDKTMNIPNSKFKNKDIKKKTKENILLKFELTINEQEILKKYSLMDNLSIKLEYNIILTQPLHLGEKEYFGDFALDDKNKKRKATAKCCEDNTILGFIMSEVYNEHIYLRNQKIIFKNIKILNQISFFKKISLMNFQKFCYNKLFLKRFNKNETLLESNTQISEIFIIKEGKVDVSLNINIFDLQNVIDEILKNFPNVNYLSSEERKLFEEIKSKKIFHNSFNKEQKENLLIRKNVNLFSLESSGIIGMEPSFLKIKSFYKVIPVSEKLSVYALSDENLNKIFSQFSDCQSDYYQLAIKKCLVVLSRLDNIKNSILNLSNFKFKNVPNNNHLEDQEKLINKKGSSNKKLKSFKISNFSSSNILNNIKTSPRNKNLNENLSKEIPIGIFDNLNERIINRKSSSILTNKSDNQFSSLDNPSNQNEEGRFIRTLKQASSSNLEKKTDEFYKLLLDKINNKNESVNFSNNSRSRNLMFDVYEKNNLSNTNINNLNNKISSSKYNSNNPYNSETNCKNSSTLLPIVNSSANNSKKIQNQFNSFKSCLIKNQLKFEQNNFEKNFVNEIKKTPYDKSIINIDKKHFKSTSCEINNKNTFNSIFNSKSNDLNNHSINDINNSSTCSKIEELYEESKTAHKNINSNEEEEDNLFFFNKNISNNIDKKPCSNGNKDNKNNIESYNYKSNKNQLEFQKIIKKENFVNNFNMHKVSSMNDIQTAFKTSNLDIGRNSSNESTQTHRNFFDFYNDSNDYYNINVYNFSNIYINGVENFENEKCFSKNKKMKSEEKHAKFNNSEDCNSPFYLNRNSNYINHDFSDLNQDYSFFNKDKRKPGVINKSVIKINNSNKKFSSQNNLLNNHLIKKIENNDTQNQYLSIKKFEDLDFTENPIKTTKFKNALVNIQRIRSRIKEFNVKKAKFSKNQI